MFEAGPGEFLLIIKGVARYWIRHGSEVVVHPEGGATEDDVRAFLLTPALGALLHQRKGVLPLHAAGIATKRGCVLLAGHSGCGKSTLAHSLTSRGYALITDDLAAVVLDSSGRPLLHHGYPAVKLWQDAAERSQLAMDTLQRVRPTIARFFVPVPATQFAADARPVRALYVIERSPGKSVRVEPLTGTERFNAFRMHTYSRRCLEAEGRLAEYFGLATTVAAQLPAYRIVRPITGTFDEIAHVMDARLR